MNEGTLPRPVPAWFTIGALLSLLFMVAGCVALALHLAADPQELPLDQRVLFQAEPAWVLAASGCGFVAGALGSILLLLRRRAAERILLLSLVAFFAWAAGMLLTPSFRDLLTTDQIAVAIAVVAVAWTIFWFARHSRQRRWLR